MTSINKGDTITIINKGDTVRISAEGVVEAAESAYITIDGKSYSPKYFDVEILKKAAPVWTNGDVVLETHVNTVWVRKHEEWYDATNACYIISDGTVSHYVEYGLMEILRQQVTND